jgi:hypothetical protein
VNASEAGAEHVTSDVYVVRTFRVSPVGGLCPLTRPELGAWSPGWNRAACDRGRRHPAPDPDCTCGLYAYSHPDYATEQPMARSCLAIIAASGQLMAGARGVRMQHARIAAVWLGPAVEEDLRAHVAARYPQTAVFTNKAAMFAEFPVTGVPGCRSPGVSRGLRRVGYSGVGLLLGAAVGLGVLPRGVVSVHPGLLAAIAGVTFGCVALALLSVILRARGRPASGPLLSLAALAGMWVVFAPGLGRPVPDAVFLHVALAVAGLWYALAWWRAGHPGRHPYPRWVTALGSVGQRRRRSGPG